MALTKAFAGTVYELAQRDARFRKVTGKAVLRDVINATIGFEQLAAKLQKPSRATIACSGRTGIPARLTSLRFFRSSRKLSE